MAERRRTQTNIAGPSLQVPGTTQAEEELRLVTVVFADLSGSTALAERLTPEDTRVVEASQKAGVKV